MPDIPIHNETEYDLTPLMLDYIQSDAMAYFGDSIHAIRVQSGLDRPTFNVKTGEVRSCSPAPGPAPGGPFVPAHGTRLHSMDAVAPMRKRPVRVRK